MIDVGGPSMLRAAAKNFAHVAPVCRPEQYAAVLAELREHGELSLETRRRLATEAFSTTAAYEAAIARWFADVEAFPEQIVPSVHEGARPRRTARTRTSAPRSTRRPARACTCSRASSSCTGRSSRTTTSTTSPPRGCSRRVHASGLRDRQAREPMRRRARGDDRGGLRQGARVRPDLGLRRRRRAQPAGRGRARRGAREAVRRGAARARLRRAARSRR